ncbi:hypothetical protein JCM10213_007838 [Rhodosporidiobolus nylandii]
MSSATTVREQPVAERNDASPAAVLPAELWLDILAFLSYGDLQRVRQDPSLDALLFRCRPCRPVPLGSSISIHPLLHAVDGLVFSPARVDIPRRLFSSPTLNAFDFPSATSELAVSPFARVLLLDLSYGHVALSSPTGVRVKAVLEALCEFWTAKTDPAGPFLSQLKKEWASVGVQRVCRIGPAARWRGWKKAWVRSDGAVVLEARISFGGWLDEFSGLGWV